MPIFVLIIFVCMRFNRILLKLSGESLAGPSKQGIDTVRLGEYVTQINEIVELGVQVVIS